MQGMNAPFSSSVIVGHSRSYVTSQMTWYTHARTHIHTLAGYYMQTLFFSLIWMYLSSTGIE